jgi:hypothetical protein
MNRKSFWSLIDHARAAAGGDPRRQVGTLEQALMQLTPDEVLGFDRHFCTLHARAVAVEAAADEEADWSHPGQLAARFPALWRIFGARQAVPGAAPTPARQSVVTETLGEIRCGDALVHARFGACVVEALEPAGRTVTLTLRFGAARKHMVLMPGQTYLTRAAVA